MTKLYTLHVPYGTAGDDSWVEPATPAEVLRYAAEVLRKLQDESENGRLDDDMLWDLDDDHSILVRERELENAATTCEDEATRMGALESEGT